MTDYTLNLVDAIMSGKATDIETAFQEAISDKISIAMETKRTELAQGMFKENVDLEEAFLAQDDKHLELYKKYDAADKKHDKTKLPSDNLEMEKAHKEFKDYHKKLHTKESVFDDARKKQADDEKKGVDPDKEYKLRMKSAQNTQRVNKALTKEEVELYESVEIGKVHHQTYSDGSKDYFIPTEQQKNKNFKGLVFTNGKKTPKTASIRNPDLWTKTSSSEIPSHVSGHVKESFDLEDYSVEELEDFMMSEDFEQLDELSKATLGSYVKKASKDIGLAGFIRGASDDNKTKSDYGRVESRRKKGIETATDKLTKEEFELEEAVTASQLIANHNSSDHGGAQHFSNVDGKHHSWNYVKKNKEGTKYEVTTDKSEAEGIAHKGKFLKMPK